MLARSRLLLVLAAALGCLLVWLPRRASREDGAAAPAPPAHLDAETEAVALSAPSELVPEPERSEAPVEVRPASNAPAATSRSERPQLAGSLELHLEIVDARGSPVAATVSAMLSRTHRVERFFERDGMLWWPSQSAYAWAEPFPLEANQAGDDGLAGVLALAPAADGGPYVLPLDDVFALALQKSTVTTRTQPLPLELVVVRAGSLRERRYGLVFALDPNQLRPERPLVLHATLQLPSVCDVTGRVRAPNGRKAQVRAAAFAWDGVEPAATAEVLVNAHDEDGSFALELSSAQAHVIVLFAEGLRPHSRTLPAGFAGDLGLNVLELGESIAGRAEIGGAGVSSLVRAEFAPPQSSSGGLRSLGSGWVRWTEKGFEWDRLSTSTDRDGRFEFHGLASARYSVELAGVSGAFASAPRASEVVAPARGLVLSPSLCRVKLQLFRSGAPAAEASFDVLDQRQGRDVQAARRTDTNGEAELWLDPERPVTVRLWVGGSDGVPLSKLEHTVLCGASAAVRVDF